jgi:predicted GNAT family acetyltransferase
VTSTSALDIRHNEAAHRFEVAVDGELARADYRVEGDVMRIFHTEVPFAFEGRGIAARLVDAAFEHAREKGLKVFPACSYVRDYVRRHPETQALLARTPR